MYLTTSLIELLYFIKKNSNNIRNQYSRTTREDKRFYLLRKYIFILFKLIYILKLNKHFVYKTIFNM